MKTIIIGGGLMGWYAAMIAVYKEHEVTLIENDKASPLTVGESLTFNMAEHCSHYLNVPFDSIENELNQGPKHTNVFKDWGRHEFSNGIMEIMKYKRIKFRHWSALKEFSHIQAGHTADVIKNYIIDKVNHQIRVVSSDETFDADFVFDCTGLHRWSLKDNTPYIKYDLPCTMATAGRVTDLQDHPYTVTRAMEAGWQWTVTLPNLTGSGYVFNPNFITPQQARERMQEYWNGKWECMVPQIKWTPGRFEKCYNNNVVALGLSAGFTEPMEAGGIASGMLVIKDILINNKSIEEVNTRWEAMLDDLAFNTSLHYKLCERTEPFWLSINKDINKDKLNMYLNEREHKFFSPACYHMLLNARNY